MTISGPTNPAAATLETPEPEGKPPRRRGRSARAREDARTGYLLISPTVVIVAVMVDEPNGQIYGGQVAAPAWKAIVNFSLSYLKIAPN